VEQRQERVPVRDLLGLLGRQQQARLRDLLVGEFDPVTARFCRALSPAQDPVRARGDIQPAASVGVTLSNRWEMWVA